MVRPDLGTCPDRRTFVDLISLFPNDLDFAKAFFSTRAPMIMYADRQTTLLNYFTSMLDRLGPSQWWPGETPFEIAVGAILTQNTNWQNVEKAIWNLRNHNLLIPERMYTVAVEDLSELIRPAGSFRIKAARLKNFIHFLRQECRFDFPAMGKWETEPLREALLTVKGIGPETADSILLYALGHPTFVVDAYTRRICNRHMLVPEDVPYEELREFFMDALPPEVPLYNEYHALLVRVGKTWCRKKNGLCKECPLKPFLLE